MTDKDFNELEFDALLENTELPPPSADVADAITPWRTAMNRILWGMGLTTLTLNFLCLDYILPTIGTLMSLLGYRALRRENKWFAAAHVLSWAKLIWHVFALFVHATVIRTEIISAIPYTVIHYSMQAVSFATLLCLRNGIKAVQEKAGLEPDVKSATGMLVWYVVMLILALISFTGILVWGFIIAYCFILRGLYKCSKLLDDAGFSIEPAPLRVSDRVLKLGYTGAILLALATGYLFFNRYPMDYQPLEETDSPQAQQIRQELSDLGFPEEVLNDLTEEEILACDGAVEVVVKVYYHPMSGDRYITTESGSMELADNSKDLKCTGVAVLLSDEREHWKLFHHFAWNIDPGFYGTESISLQNMDTRYSSGWSTDRNYSGRVLYDVDGVTYTAPFYQLSSQPFISDSPFASMFGQSTTSNIYANFSFEKGGSRYRSYLTYDIRQNQDGYIVDAVGEYTHQMHPVQFPVKTAMEGSQIFLGDELEVFKSGWFQLMFRTQLDEEEPQD